jgi:outer membrane protein assembly factor BamB
MNLKRRRFRQSLLIAAREWRNNRVFASRLKKSSSRPADRRARSQHAFPLLPRLEVLEGRDCPAATAAAWGMYGHDVLGSRDNTQEHVLTAKNVGTLGLKWAFNGFSFGAPAVMGGVVYATNGNGVVALDEKTGAMKWDFTGAGFVSDSPLVTQGVVVFGDWNGDVWGLDAATGNEKW